MKYKTQCDRNNKTTSAVINYCIVKNVCRGYDRTGGWQWPTIVVCVTVCVACTHLQRGRNAHEQRYYAFRLIVKTSRGLRDLSSL